MKEILTITLLVASFTLAPAQIINWSALQNRDRHIVNLYVGWDYAATVGMGYGYRLNTQLPIIFNAQLSIPAGNNLTDDFKTKLGGQIRVFKTNNLIASVLAYGIFRRYESDMATLQNFGSEFTGIAGYYKSTWFVAWEFGFDKAIATHVRNSEMMKQTYPMVQDGWYVPTGGNFHYGLQGGYSLRETEINLTFGKVSDQSFQSPPIVPYYLQLGVNRRF